MWNLFGKYKGKKVLPSARQMNLIAAVLNHVTQGTGIKMDQPQTPSTDAPWVIGVDTEWLKSFVGGGSGYSGAANSLIKSDANGALAALVALPTSNTAKDKVLSVLKGGTEVSWADAAAQNHTSPKDLTVSGEGTAAANTGTGNQWTCDGTQGVKITVQTRTYYDHTSTTPVLYGYYRTFTFDRNGRLYSVSAEARYTIDTPVVGNITTS